MVNAQEEETSQINVILFDGLITHSTLRPSIVQRRKVLPIMDPVKKLKLTQETVRTLTPDASVLRPKIVGTTLPICPTCSRQAGLDQAQ